jgi:hypothetical protein
MFCNYLYKLAIVTFDLQEKPVEGLFFWNITVLSSQTQALVSRL